MLSAKTAKPGYESYLVEKVAQLLAKEASGEVIKAEDLDKWLQKLDDYYVSTGSVDESVGAWYDPNGVLKEFDINDNQLVSPESFKMLMAGYDPKSGTPLYKECEVRDKDTGKVTNKHVGGTDAEYSPPKDYSILYMLASPADKAKMDAIFNESIRDGLDFLNNNAAFTRVNRKEVPVKFAAALFDHGTNRNGDPHRHKHCMILNMAKINGKWQTMDNRQIFNYRKAADATINATLMRRLQAEFPALHVEPTANAFKIGNIPRSLVDGWSSRRNDMLDALRGWYQERGVGEISEKDVHSVMDLMFYQTRKAKTYEDVANLNERWIEQAVQFQVADLVGSGNDAQQLKADLVQLSTDMRNGTITYDEIINNELLPQDLARKAAAKQLTADDAKMLTYQRLLDKGYNPLMASRLLEKSMSEEEARNHMLTPEGLKSLLAAPGIGAPEALARDSEEARNHIRGVIKKFLETESAFRDQDVYERALKEMFGLMTGSQIIELVDDLKNGVFDIGEYESGHVEESLQDIEKQLLVKEIENAATGRKQPGSGELGGFEQPNRQHNGRIGVAGGGLGLGRLFLGELISGAGMAGGRAGNAATEDSVFDAVELDSGSFGQRFQTGMRKLSERLMLPFHKSSADYQDSLLALQGSGSGRGDHGVRPVSPELIKRDKLEFVRTENGIKLWSVSSQKEVERRLQLETGRLSRLLGHPIDMNYVDKVLAQVTKKTEHDALAALEEKYGQTYDRILGKDSTASPALKATFQAAVDACQNSMSEEQAAAVRYALEANDFRMIRGRAGVGKSFSLKVMREVYEHFGCTVVGMAIGHSQKTELIASTGIKSSAIAGFIKDYEDGKLKLEDKTIIVVDECGLIGSRTAAKLLEIQAKHGCKIIMTGDEAQHQAVEAGPAMKIMMLEAGSCIISAIRRQKQEWERQMVTDLSEGRSLTALAALDSHGQLIFGETREATIMRMVNDWREYTAANPGKTTLMLAVSNQDCRMMVDEIRKTLKARGTIGQVDTFIKCKAQGGTDSSATIDLGFSVGDRITLRKNIKGDDIFNKNEAVITAIKPSKKGSIELHVTFDDGRQFVLDEVKYKDKASGGMPIHHAYASTSHSSQGATRDKTFALMTWMDRFAAYVMCSRQRDSVDCYADESRLRMDIARQDPDKVKITRMDMMEQLAKQIHRNKDKTCTIDLELQEAVSRKMSAAEKCKQMLADGYAAIHAAAKSLERMKEAMTAGSSKVLEAIKSSSAVHFEADKRAMERLMEKVNNGEITIDSTKLEWPVAVEEIQLDQQHTNEIEPEVEIAEAEFIDDDEVELDDIQDADLNLVEQMQHEMDYQRAHEDADDEVNEDYDEDENEHVQGMVR